MNTSREIIRGSAWVSLGYIATLAIGFATNIILARMLDKDNWGIFSTMMAVVSFLSVLADLGLNYSIVQRGSSVAGGPVKGIRDKLSTPFTYKLLLILAISGLIFVSSQSLADLFHIQDGKKYFEVSAVFFLVYNIFVTIDTVFSSLKMLKEATITSLAQFAFRLVLSYVLVVIGLGVEGAVLGYITAVAISVLIQGIWVRKYISITYDSKEDVKEMFLYGFYFGLGSLATIIAVWTDSIIIGLMMGTTAVGIYRIALSMTTAVSGMLGILVSKVFFPSLSMSESQGLNSIEHLNKILKYASFFAFPAMIGLALTASGIVNIFYTSQYSDSILPMAILSYICFDTLFTGILVSYLGAKKETRTIASSSAISTVANVILNVIMIPSFGLVGAAIASVVSRIGNAFALIFWSKSELREKLVLSNFTTPLFGSFIMGAILFLISPYLNPSASVLSLFVFTGIGMAVYAVAEQLLGFDVILFARKIIGAFL